MDYKTLELMLQPAHFIVKEAEWLPDSQRVVIVKDTHPTMLYVQNLYIVVFACGSDTFEDKLNQCVLLAKEKINRFVDEQCNKYLTK